MILNFSEFLEFMKLQNFLASLSNFPVYLKMKIESKENFFKLQQVSCNESSTPSIRSSSSVFTRERECTPRSPIISLSTANNHTQNCVGGGTMSEQWTSNSRAAHRTPVPTIIHTPATPSHQFTHTPMLSKVNLTKEDDSQRSLSEILLSASRKPLKPFVPSDLSLESIDCSASPSRTCSPVFKSNQSIERAFIPKLLSPTSMTHRSLR